MASLAQAEHAHFARLDGAYQRQLDDEAAFDAAAERALTEAENLQDLEDAGWRPDHLETTKGFDRYTLGAGMVFFACPECGSIQCDPEDGCIDCGFGAFEDDQ